MRWGPEGVFLKILGRQSNFPSLGIRVCNRFKNESKVPIYVMVLLIKGKEAGFDIH